MVDSSTTAALIAACGVVGAGIVAWLSNLSVRERTKDHDTQLTNLRAQISENESRRLAQTEREQASHEAQLRERVEFKLKLYGLAAESVAGASNALSKAFNDLLLVARAAQDAGEITRFNDSFTALLTAGIFLPPALDKPYGAAMGQLASLYQALVKSFAESPEQAKKDAPSMIAREFGSALGTFRGAAERWKTEIWHEGAPSK